MQSGCKQPKFARNLADAASLDNCFGSPDEPSDILERNSDSLAIPRFRYANLG